MAKSRAILLSIIALWVFTISPLKIFTLYTKSKYEPFPTPTLLTIQTQSSRHYHEKFITYLISIRFVFILRWAAQEKKSDPFVPVYPSECTGLDCAAYGLCEPYCEDLNCDQSVYISQICPYSSITPEGMICFYLFYSFKYVFVTKSYRIRLISHIMSYSVFFNSTVSEPIIWVSSLFFLLSSSSSLGSFLESKAL